MVALTHINNRNGSSSLSELLCDTFADAMRTTCHYCYLALIFHSGYLKNGSIVANNSDFCTTPLVLHITSPRLNSINVGTDCMPY